LIRKLKTKFIFTNMFLVILVLCASFVILYINSAGELERSSKDAMRDIAHSNRDDLGGLFDKNGGTKTKYPHLSTYIIDVDERTNKCYIDGFGNVDNLTEENINYINDLIHAVNISSTQDGILEEYNLRFHCENMHFGKRIVLLDKQYEDESLQRLLMSFLLSGGIAIIAFFIISMVIANIAVKPVEKSIKQQQQLVSDISHELKTPIAVIATNADLLLSRDSSTIQEDEKWLLYIKDETARMAELVNTMLYLAKSDESNEIPTLNHMNLSNAIYEIALPFESICFEKGKDFSINIEPDVFIKGDENSIKQLLLILLDNAIKYSNENGKIILSLQAKNDKALMSVFNTGNPIPKESIPHLFERFYRVDEARSRDSGGSGLGLSIAKRVIEYNEASISVLSNEQNGTVFTCTFKLDKTNKKEDTDSKFHNTDLT